MTYHDQKLTKHEQGLPILAALGLLLLGLLSDL